MARPRAPDFEERREQILDHAARLFARDGFLGASLSELAEACKLSKAALYHYFYSKEHLLFAVMETHIQALDLAVREVAATDATPEEKLRTLTLDFMILYVGAVDRHKVLLHGFHFLPKNEREGMVIMQRELIAAVEKILIELEPRLKKRKGASRAAAMLYFGMINWTHTWYRPLGPISPKDFAEMVVDMTLGGLPNIK